MDIFTTYFLPTPYAIAVGVTLGLLLGSFTTAVAYRVPRGMNWVSDRSKCPSCGHVLGILDLFPLLSWVLLRGKCRYCKTSFGTSYPLAELCVAAITTLWVVQFGLSLLTLIGLLLTISIVAMSIIDFEFYIIPDGLNLFMLLLGAAYCVILGTSLDYLLLAPLLGLGFGLALRWGMYAWKRKEALGLGDVKFLAVAGLFIPFENFPAFLFLSGMLGIVIALIWRWKKAGERFPFGPALGMSMLVCVLFPSIGQTWQEILVNLVVYVQGV